MRARVRAAEPQDVALALAVARRVCDLDADPEAVDAVLAADPVLRPHVLATPGRRVPGTPDPFELAVRAVLGQQVSVRAATTLAGRLARALGEPLPAPEPGLTHLFPTPDALLAAPPELLPMPASRRRTLRALAAAPALDPVTLAALPGIGPWTLAYVAMRLGDRDAFLPTDLVARRVLARLGLSGDAPERWRPYRAHALMHLWALSSGG